MIVLPNVDTIADSLDGLESYLEPWYKDALSDILSKNSLELTVAHKKFQIYRFSRNVIEFLYKLGLNRSNFGEYMTLGFLLTRLENWSWTSCPNGCADNRTTWHNVGACNICSDIGWLAENENYSHEENIEFWTNYSHNKRYIPAKRDPDMFLKQQLDDNLRSVFG